METNIKRENSHTEAMEKVKLILTSNPVLDLVVVCRDHLEM